MITVLRGFGWLGLAVSSVNAGLKLFADDAVLLRYSGQSRNLDENISICAFSLIFIALATILAELRKDRS